jgi:nucleoside-triphosphatase THEP1
LIDAAGARIALLTGPVGAGKTTVAERVVGLARQQGLHSGGLLAPAMKNACGQKAGIWGVDAASGERRLLARTDRTLGGPEVGPYSFDEEALAWSVGVVEAGLAADLVVVDEIGKLELWRGTGLAPVLPRLAAGEARRALVLVREGLREELEARLAPARVVVFRIDAQNRDDLPRRIVEAFSREDFVAGKEI